MYASSQQWPSKLPESSFKVSPTPLDSMNSLTAHPLSPPDLVLLVDPQQLMVRQNRPLAQQLLFSSIFLTLQVVLLTLFTPHWLTFTLLPVVFLYRTLQCVKIVYHYVDGYGDRITKTPVCAIVVVSDDVICCLEAFPGFLRYYVTEEEYACFNKTATPEKQRQISDRERSEGSEFDTATKHF